MHCIAATAVHVPVAARPGASPRRGGAPCSALPKRAASVDAAAARPSSSETAVLCTVCTASEEHADCEAVGMATKSKCIHPDRPVAKACADCPRRKGR